MESSQVVPQSVIEHKATLDFLLDAEKLKSSIQLTKDHYLALLQKATSSSFVDKKNLSETVARNVFKKSGLITRDFLRGKPNDLIFGDQWKVPEDQILDAFKEQIEKQAEQWIADIDLEINKVNEESKAIAERQREYNDLVKEQENISREFAGRKGNIERLVTKAAQDYYDILKKNEPNHTKRNQQKVKERFGAFLVVDEEKDTVDFENVDSTLWAWQLNPLSKKEKTIVTKKEITTNNTLAEYCVQFNKVIDNCYRHTTLGISSDSIDLIKKARNNLITIAPNVFIKSKKYLALHPEFNKEQIIIPESLVEQIKKDREKPTLQSGIALVKKIDQKKTTFFRDTITDISAIEEQKRKLCEKPQEKLRKKHGASSMLETELERVKELHHSVDKAFKLKESEYQNAITNLRDVETIVTDAIFAVDIESQETQLTKAQQIIADAADEARQLNVKSTSPVASKLENDFDVSSKKIKKLLESQKKIEKRQTALLAQAAEIKYYPGKVKKFQNLMQESNQARDDLSVIEKIAKEFADEKAVFDENYQGSSSEEFKQAQESFEKIKIIQQKLGAFDKYKTPDNKQFPEDFRSDVITLKGFREKIAEHITAINKQFDALKEHAARLAYYGSILTEKEKCMTALQKAKEYKQQYEEKKAQLASDLKSMKDNVLNSHKSAEIKASKLKINEAKNHINGSIISGFDAEHKAATVYFAKVKEFDEKKWELDSDFKQAIRSSALTIKEEIARLSPSLDKVEANDVENMHDCHFYLIALRQAQANNYSYQAEYKKLQENLSHLGKHAKKGNAERVTTLSEEIITQQESTNQQVDQYKENYDKVQELHKKLSSYSDSVFTSTENDFKELRTIDLLPKVDCSKELNAQEQVAENSVKINQNAKDFLEFFYHIFNDAENLEKFDGEVRYKGIGGGVPLDEKNKDSLRMAAGNKKQYDITKNYCMKKDDSTVDPVNEVEKFIQAAKDRLAVKHLCSCFNPRTTFTGKWYSVISKCNPRDINLAVIREDIKKLNETLVLPEIKEEQQQKYPRKRRF